MKRLFVLILVFLLLPVTALAHSGKTDGNGGHWDHSNDEYHYHHGYPAHDHYDIDGDGDIDCPYLFDNKTDQNSDSVVQPDEPDNTNNPQESQTSSKPRHYPRAKSWLQFLGLIVWYLGYFVMAFFIVGHIWLFISYCIGKLTRISFESKNLMDNVAVVIIIVLLVVLYFLHLYWALPY